MFKMKRRDSDGKLPMITTVHTDHKPVMMSTRGIEKFSTFDSIIRSSTKRQHLSQSPERINETHYSRNRSKMGLKKSPKQERQPVPFIVRRYNKISLRQSVEKSKSTSNMNTISHASPRFSEISSYFSLADKLMKKGKVFV
jgi:hypothetical protein